MSRPSWDETWLAVAKQVAARSLCSRAQVGAVITDSRNRIVATGYNGPPADYPLPTYEDTSDLLMCGAWCTRAQLARVEKAVDYTDCPSLHAEANALLAADRSSWQGGTIYVTGVVCHACGKLIANSGLKRVVIAREDTDRSYRVNGHGLLRHCGLDVVEF